jgi:hypothetical protein
MMSIEFLRLGKRALWDQVQWCGPLVCHLSDSIDLIDFLWAVDIWFFIWILLLIYEVTSLYS